MRTRISFLVVALALLTSLSSCVLTRTETDYYTITDRDTTFRENVRNVPGSSEDNGVVFPSSRTTIVNRHSLSHDSTYDRTYPNFLRAGGLEFAGLIGTSSTSAASGGLFGVYTLFNNDQFSDSLRNGSLWRPYDSSRASTSNSSLFKGELIRVGALEKRLRWLNDDSNWTIGWSAFEMLAPDANRDHWLTSVALNTYLRKRFYLHDRIPYVIVAPFVGGSIYPSMYLNAGGELQVGSLAGMSVRAYLGYAGGFTWNNNAGFNSFPYAGLGISVLDFTNRVEETEREWKEYVHSAININVVNFTLLRSGASYETLFEPTRNYPFTGLQVSIASTELPLPFLNRHFWAGTSLFNYMALGFTKQGIGILPIRAGYRQYVISNDLMLEPFLEYNYYPSTFFNAGVRFKWDTKTNQNIAFIAGYATGSPGDFAPNAFNSGAAKEIVDFSTAYFGVSFLLGDYNWTPEEVQALRASEH